MFLLYFEMIDGFNWVYLVVKMLVNFAIVFGDDSLK